MKKRNANAFFKEIRRPLNLKRHSRWGRTAKGTANRPPPQVKPAGVRSPKAQRTPVKPVTLCSNNKNEVKRGPWRVCNTTTWNRLTFHLYRNTLQRTSEECELEVTLLSLNSYYSSSLAARSKSWTHYKDE